MTDKTEGKSDATLSDVSEKLDKLIDILVKQTEVATPPPQAAPVYHPPADVPKKRSKRIRVEPLPADFDGPFANMSPDLEDDSQFGLWVPVEAMEAPLDVMTIEDEEWDVIAVSRWNKGEPSMRKAAIIADAEDCPKAEGKFGINEGKLMAYVKPDEWRNLSTKSVAVPKEVAKLMTRKDEDI